MNNSACNRMPRQWFDSMMSSLRQNLANAERGAGGAASAPQRGNTCGDGRPVPAKSTYCAHSHDNEALFWVPSHATAGCNPRAHSEYRDL